MCMILAMLVFLLKQGRIVRIYTGPALTILGVECIGSTFVKLKNVIITTFWSLNHPLTSVQIGKYCVAVSSFCLARKCWATIEKCIGINFF